MKKKKYIIPESLKASLYMPKSLCDGPGDMGDSDPSLINGVSGTNTAWEAPGRIKLYN